MPHGHGKADGECNYAGICCVRMVVELRMELFFTCIELTGYTLAGALLDLST